MSEIADVADVVLVDPEWWSKIRKNAAGTETRTIYIEIALAIGSDPRSGETAEERMRRVRATWHLDSPAGEPVRVEDFTNLHLARKVLTRRGFEMIGSATAIRG